MGVVSVVGMAGVVGVPLLRCEGLALVRVAGSVKFSLLPLAILLARPRPVDSSILLRKGRVWFGRWVV